MVRIPIRNNADEAVGERSKLRRRKWLVLVLVTATGLGWKTRALISRFVASRRPTSGANESPPIQPAGPSDHPNSGGPATGRPTVGGATSATAGTGARSGAVPGPQGLELSIPTPLSAAGRHTDSVDRGLANEASATPPTEPTEPLVAPLVESADPTTKTDSAGDAQASAGGATHVPETLSEGENGDLGAVRRDSGQPSPTTTADMPSRLDATPGWVRGDGSPNCPASHPLKGNGSSRIFHRPGESSYATTIPEFCFATEDDATAAGFRPRAR